MTTTTEGGTITTTVETTSVVEREKGVEDLHLMYLAEDTVEAEAGADNLRKHHLNI